VHAWRAAALPRSLGRPLPLRWVRHQVCGDAGSLRAVTRPDVLHRPQLLGLRRRAAFGACGLRPAVAQHSQAEAALLQQHAAGAHTIVELGVAEGGSALELRQVMDSGGELVLVDPYDRGPLGISFSQLVARRTVGRCATGTVTWIRATSSEAARRWRRDIDFLFIDADHALDAVRQDWQLWAPRVRVGGCVALHDARTDPGGWSGDRAWITSAAGPVVLSDAVRLDDAWELAGEVETTVVFRRRS